MIVAEYYMKFLNICISAFFLVSLTAGVASAQESGSSGKYHPFLSDKFVIGLGAYRPDKSFELGADLGVGGGSGAVIDASDSETTGLMVLHWRYTKNWSFQASYWDTDSETKHVLRENFKFGDQEFLAGTSVETGLKASVTRLFWGRSFFRRPSTDWGVGLGLHWLDIEASIKGEILVAPPVPGLAGRESSSVSAPLPNFGIWYMYSWSPKWVVSTRLDWLDVSYEEYSGHLWDVSVGVNHQVSDHFGIGLAVNGFRLDVFIDGTDWRGGIVQEEVGPLLSLTWNW